MDGFRTIALDLVHGLRDRLSIPERVRDTPPYRWISDAYWRQRARSVSPMSVNVGDASARFIVDTKHEYGRFRTLMGERAVLARLLENIQPGDVFWDVGANVGLYSVLAAALPVSTQVHAFEPHPRMAERLKENADLNEAALGIHPIGLWDRSGEGTISSPDIPVGLGTPAVSEEEDDGVQIELRTGDTLIKQGLPSPDLVKIDVEGAERRVLSGMKETLSSGGRCRFILVEVHSAGSSSDREGTEVREVLESSGYEIEAHERRDEAILIGRK